MAWIFGKAKKKFKKYNDVSSVFGSCCFTQGHHLKMMNAKSVKIEGTQQGLIANFELTQTFFHTEKDLQEVSYIFPNDLKFCIYDTTFVIGQTLIKTKLKSKEEAKSIYKEAVDSGLTAVYASNITNGLTEFKLGNIKPNQECKVILKIAFTAQMTEEKRFYIKFPLDVYNPSGSLGCLDVISSDFNFKIQFDKQSISNVTSNVINGKFDKSTQTFSITNKIESYSNQKSIIVTFETKENIESSILITAPKLINYDFCAVTIAPTLPTTANPNSEFIFLVDCSGSMSGDSIQKASECLDLFIHSIPPESYFNVYQFGTSFKKLFQQSEKYTDETAMAGLQLAKSLQANLGGTNIYQPLSDIFADKNRHGQRQIFIMTDGEVDNASEVLQLIKKNSTDNRCFTIGIGRGCDAGLVEGMANSSGGKSDFVQEGDMISEKVIPQLRDSIHTFFDSIEIHLEGENNSSFMVSPFPLPKISAHCASVVYLRKEKVKGETNSPFHNGLLISGKCNNESFDFPIEKVEILNEIKEEEESCGRDISKAIPALFAFNILNVIEHKNDVSEDEKEMAIKISISSGVLCKFTAYVGISECNVELEENGRSEINRNIELLRSKSKLNENKSKEALTKAISNKRKGNKKIAKRYLNQKIVFDKNVEKYNNMIYNLQIQQDQSQHAQLQFLSRTAFTRACEARNFDYDAINDELQDIKGKSNEITDALMAPNFDVSYDVDELYDNLDVGNATIDDDDDEINSLMSAFDDDHEANKSKKDDAIEANKSKKDDAIEADKSKKDDAIEADKSKKDDAIEADKSKKDDAIEANKSKKDDAIEADKNNDNDNDSNNSNQPIKPNEKFNFMSLTQLQKVDGYWDDLETLNKILGLKVNSIDGVKCSNKIIEKNCVATILAIAALRVKSSNERNSWMMIEIKAINWLKKQLNEINIEQIITETQNLI